MPKNRSSKHDVRYKQVAGLLKPPKRTVARALPSALHIGGTGTLSILIFATINVSVTYSLGHNNKWSKLVQQGTQMAMITVTLLAMPNLGKSVTKGIQRIAGVMAGVMSFAWPLVLPRGWIFYALYASCQQWWFLAICLATWAFALVSMSFLLTGQQFLSPVALITAFVVATGFDTVERAFVNTVVKTVAISGAIALYTLVSMLVFPVTATQQLLGSLSDAVAALHELSDLLLLKGQPSLSAIAPEPCQTDKALTVRAAKSVDANCQEAAPAAAAEPAFKAESPTTVVTSEGRAVQLAAAASHHLQMVAQLLPAAQKERYVGRCGSHRCFVPSAADRGIDHSIVAAVLFSASQVLRALLTIMEEFGSTALVHCAAPANLITSKELQLLQPMAESAVAALKDLSHSLLLTGSPHSSVNTSNLSSFGEMLKQLIAATFTSAPLSNDTQQQCSDSIPQAVLQAAPRRLDNRWKAAAAAAGSKPEFFSAGKARPESIAAAFSSMLTDSVLADEAQTVRWCTMLALTRQLGKSIMALAQSMNKLLSVLPGAATVQEHAQTSQQASASGTAIV